ncbi:MAG TPA: hypothetical protein VHV10_16515 [Ktedonobacteraceae bacterium]|jgi:hypothetical protein|nr:hypothetical protein [Ktedonobacteraceae bacterium]
MPFLLKLVEPHAVTALFVAASCLFGFGYPGYQARNWAWVLWLIIGILAIVSWVMLVFS